MLCTGNSRPAISYIYCELAKVAGAPQTRSRSFISEWQNWRARHASVERVTCVRRWIYKEKYGIWEREFGVLDEMLDAMLDV